MKKCKSCKSDIDDKASKCPHCKSDQRIWFRRHPILTGILAFVVLIVVIAASNGGKNNSQKVGENSTQANTAQQTKSQGDQAYKVGDSIKMGGVILTVNNVDLSQGGQYTKPAEGNQWVNLNLTIENTGSTQQYVTTLGQMFILDDKNNQYQVAVTDKRLANPGSTGLDGAIVAGAKKTDWVGFETPKSAKGLKFQYQASFFDNKKIMVDLGL